MGKVMNGEAEIRMKHLIVYTKGFYSESAPYKSLKVTSVFIWGNVHMLP